MRKWNRIFAIPAVLLLVVFLSTNLFSEQVDSDKPSLKLSNLSQTTIGDPKFEKAEVLQKTKKLQMPFIANEGQTDAKVAFYANTFGGAVFVTRDGEIVYSLPMVAHASPLVHNEINKDKTGYTGLTGFQAASVETQCLASLMHSPNGISPLKRGTHPLPLSRGEYKSPLLGGDSGVGKFAIQNLSPTSIGEPKSGVALKEEFVGAKVKTIQGEEISVTKVNYFKGNDPSKWKTNVSTYDFVNLGEIYKGIELKLKGVRGQCGKTLLCETRSRPCADKDQSERHTTF